MDLPAAPRSCRHLVRRGQSSCAALLGRWMVGALGALHHCFWAPRLRRCLISDLARHLQADGHVDLGTICGPRGRPGLVYDQRAAPGRAAGIYYPTWTRLDPLVFGVGLAGLERFRPRAWTRLTDAPPWLWLPGAGLIAGGLSLGEGDLTVGVCAWQFPLIALGMVAWLVCALSPRLPWHRLPVPGAAAVAGGTYSVYLSHKLTMHGVAACCGS